MRTRRPLAAIALAILASLLPLPAAAAAAAPAEGSGSPAPSPAISLAPEPSPWIVVFPTGLEPSLRNHGVSVWGRSGAFVLGGAVPSSLADLAAEGVVPSLEIADRGQWIYLLTHREQFVPPTMAGAQIYTLSPTSELVLFPGERKVELPFVKPMGGFMAIPRIDLPPIEPHPADANLGAASAAPASLNPLVSQILAATD